MTRLTETQYDQVLAVSSRGAQWLVNHLDDEGRFCRPPDNDVVNRYHKIPLALMTNGHWGPAGRVIDHFGRTFVQPQGLVDVSNPFSTNTETYIESWITWAAQLGGRFGFAQQLADSIEAKLHPELGGAYDDYADQARKAPLNLEIQGGAGMALLAVGRIEAAKRVGRFAQHAWRSQPRRDATLHNYFNDNGQAVVEFPPEQALSYVFEAGAVLQPLANLGFVINFLIKLDGVAPGEGFLEAARSFFDWAVHALPDHDRCPQHHKFGWSAAMLYELTGDESYFDVARNLCRASVAAQQRDGGWRSPILCEDYDTQPLAITVAMTTDSSTWPRMAAETLRPL